MHSHRFSPFMLWLVVMVPLNAVHAQTSAPAGIFTAPVYSSVSVTKDIIYGSNVNPFFNNTLDTLRLDIYQPDSVIDYRRPVLIYCHGGGYSSGDKETDKAVAFGNFFPTYGYLYASIDYRLFQDNLYDSIDNFQAAYMATEDALAAVRFFRRYANEYCVDTSAIFMIGTSAGGSIALTSAYLDQSEADLLFDTTGWGQLSNASGNDGYSTSMHGVISCWGGVTDTSWFFGESTPNILFHGTDDPIVPYTQGIAADGIYLFGSYVIHETCLNDGVASVFHPFVGAGHGVGTSSPQFDTLEQMTTGWLLNLLPAGEGFTPCLPDLTGPQPHDDFLNIYVDSDDQIVIKNQNSNAPFDGAIRIVSVTGIEIFSRRIFIPANSTVQLSCGTVASGCYLAQLCDSQEEAVFKLLIY